MFFVFYSERVWAEHFHLYKNWRLKYMKCAFLQNLQGFGRASLLCVTWLPVMTTIRRLRTRCCYTTNIWKNKSILKNRSVKCQSLCVDVLPKLHISIRTGKEGLNLLDSLKPTDFFYLKSSQTDFFLHSHLHLLLFPSAQQPQQRLQLVPI